MHTTGTIVMGPSFWNAKVAPLTQQSDFLMHAFLATAASHLRSLLSDTWGPTYERMELHHLCRSLRLFQEALDTPNIPVHSLLACSVLLLHHSWKSCIVQNDSKEQDSLLPLASGVQKIIWKVKKELDPAFIDLWRICGPTGSVITYANSTDVSHKLENDLLSQYKQLSPCISAPEDKTAFLSAARNLIPVLAILRILPSFDPNLAADIESDIQAYLFHWPAKSDEELRRLFENHYDAAQLLFLYYYDAVLKLFPVHCWWAKTRAEALYRDIWQKLKGRCGIKLQEHLADNRPM
ncbi:hypothetical protein K491DRAFT_715961 [Lophiostoma macrostomum CBS 122681]|uniref:C6 finger domain protein n=1 Tax=Lophiostoma macrostomum CBS 122681 TaxID=1314788 RepID=A0A6A6T737_9PLEO|nr:hypothetical protein K491DRAFT_715961 [Lophiostoma macrostomum CBS 122681]